MDYYSTPRAIHRKREHSRKVHLGDLLTGNSTTITTYISEYMYCEGTELNFVIFAVCVLEGPWRGFGVRGLGRIASL